MPTFTSGSAILTDLELAATRPWQANDNSKAPPMQVPLMAETQGLPLVSTLRHSRAMRPAASKSFWTAVAGSFAFSWASMENIDLIMVRSAPPEKDNLPPVKTMNLTTEHDTGAYT